MIEARGLVLLQAAAAACVVCSALWLIFGIASLPVRHDLGPGAADFGLVTIAFALAVQLRQAARGATA
jgi:hypothetical protein